MDLAISLRNTPSSFSTIPYDLTVEILSRLPVKSIARFRCVSKQCASILLRPYFTERFLTVSSTRPRLLFTYETDSKWLFFSLPQPLNPDQNSSLIVSADYHMCFPTGDCSSWVSAPVRGLIVCKGMICNPSTGQYITLPEHTSTMKSTEMKTYFGYDPVEKQFKVLCVSDKAEEQQVLTLETGLLSWRMVECSIPHYPVCVGVCINGILYYKARTNEFFMIVCFDVRSENFEFIMDHRTETWLSTLINYKGKLGALGDNPIGVYSGGSTSITLHVLDDAEEPKWSRHTYLLPPSWGNVVADTWLWIVGITNSGEIVLSSYVVDDPFYVFYYNDERNTITRVEIQGIGLVKDRKIYICLNHVEDVKLNNTSAWDFIRL